jgi:hypothetical protein
MIAIHKYEANMANSISAAVLAEILRAYASEEVGVPTDKAIRELSAAAGLSQQAVKNDYTTAYANAGHEGDPWDPMPVATRS